MSGAGRKKGRRKAQQAEVRHRTGGPLLGAYPDLDARIIDLRRHNVVNTKRYAVRNGGGFIFAPSVTDARKKIISKGIVTEPRKGDEQKALAEVRGFDSLDLEKLEKAAAALGLKLVKSYKKRARPPKPEAPPEPAKE